MPCDGGGGFENWFWKMWVGERLLSDKSVRV
jgi:hypothetical protein